jgi:hypothetical protein
MALNARMGVAKKTWEGTKKGNPMVRTSGSLDTWVMVDPEAGDAYQNLHSSL